MPLSAGDRLGPYEILAPIGKGGMGEVYRARDTKLEREVAIKVLAASLAREPDRLARFEREAKVLASLNHPNIAHIYGIEEASGVRALVMELVLGATLKGPLPLQTVLCYARQIADALEAAHEKGITHRDLKPANIMVTPAGLVKVLDFGLAAVGQASSPGGGNSDDSPTLTMPLTHAGMIMGTAAYMSPEQARGETVDQRTDIWAFGAVLSEMLTGEPLFRGKTVSDILVEVLGREPDLSALPAHARYVVERCLRKDPRKRWQAIGDVRIALEEGAPQAAPAPETSRAFLPWAVAAALLLVAVITSFLAWRTLRPPAVASDLPLIRLDADLGPDVQAPAAYAATFASISPDGSRLLYSVKTPDGKQMLASRFLDKPAGSAIAGTENGSAPFFSPDGQWIGFFTDNKLKKVALNGGAPVTLAEVFNPRGASWGEDGTIIAALNNAAGLYRIDAAGGSAPQPLTQLRAGELTHRWPQVPPGGQAVLFTVSTNLSDYENASVELLTFKTGERRVVQTGGYFGRYTADGHLLYVHGGALFALPFSGLVDKPQGGPVQILNDVASNSTSAAGQFDVSRTGIFVYRTGKSVAQTWSIAAFDAGGSRKLQPQLSKPAPYFMPRFSPDGRHLALAIEEAKGLDLHVYDLQGDGLSRLTFGQQTFSPVWMPDGKHIVLQSIRSGGNALSWIRSDGAGEVQTLLERTALLRANSISPDGRHLAYQQDNRGNFDIWILPLDLTDPEHPQAGKPEPFAQTNANETQPAFSPDGRWLALASDESGVYEVYVRPFPETAGGGKWQISSGGGSVPVWSRDGKNLFFENPDNRIMVSGYTAKGGSFEAGKPRLWSSQQLATPTGGEANYDLAPDGKTVEGLVASPAEENKASLHVTFLLNFFDELRRRTSQSK